MYYDNCSLKVGIMILGNILFPNKEMALFWWQKISERWNVNPFQSPEFNLGGYVKALFFAEKGFYRIIAILVTSEDIPNWSETVQAKQANEWIAEGIPSIFRYIAEQPLSSCWSGKGHHRKILS